MPIMCQSKTGAASVQCKSGITQSQQNTMGTGPANPPATTARRATPRSDDPMRTGNGDPVGSADPTGDPMGSGDAMTTGDPL